MNSKLDSYLVTKYPKLFIKRYEDMKSTAMCWGFECGDGWFWLLDNLCQSIQSYIDYNTHKNITQVTVEQVKEKFGGLRFYIEGGDDTIHGMISLAERMSYNICETCGSTENIGQTSGWIKNICEDCAKLDTKSNWKKREIPQIEISKELRKIKLDKLNQ